MQGVMKTWYIHKMDAQQQYGGPEEGGWWFDLETPISPRSSRYMEPIEVVGTEDKAFAVCRRYNEAEGRRRKGENKYGYTSVLSHRDTFYSYDVQESDIPHPNPNGQVHYE